MYTKAKDMRRYKDHLGSVHKMKNSSHLFDFKCPDCYSDNIRLFPTEIEFKTAGTEQLPPLNCFIDNLPTMREALEIARSVGCFCVDCNMSNEINHSELDKIELRKHIKKFDKKDINGVIIKNEPYGLEVINFGFRPKLKQVQSKSK